jgi:hypothetical protein
MIPNRKIGKNIGCRIAAGKIAAGILFACSMFAGLHARAQDSSSDQPPLGDVVRRQQEQRQHAGKAKRVVGDEDVAGSNMHQITGAIATTVIIPYIRVTGMVPDGVTVEWPPNPRQKLSAWFTPFDSCFDLECAKAAYIRQFPMIVGGKLTLLFESDDSVGGYPANVAHFKVVHDVRGKSLGIVAWIQTPASVAAASCMYHEEDSSVAEIPCEQFIASVQVHVPERYMYVDHNR